MISSTVEMSSSDMADDITIPKVGSVPKKVIIPLVIGVAGFVGWRFWVARNSTGTGDSTEPASDFADGGTTPDVLGAVSPNNSYGSNTGDSGSTTSKTTDAEWTNDATEKLVASDTWSYTDIVSALGNYLANKPTTDIQQQIIRAAIAVAGYPYATGAHTIVSGGNTDLTVAPSALKVTTLGNTSATISFTGVPGATEYRAYRGVGVNVAATHASPIIVAGLSPNTDYTVTIQGLTASGKYSPSSAPLKFKTNAYTLAKPSTPTVSGIGTTSATVTTKAVAHADGYRWYINGGAHGYSEAPTYKVGGLGSKKKYTVTVAADLAHQNPGPTSAGKQFTTK